MPLTVYKLSKSSRLVLYYLTDNATPANDGSGDKTIIVKKKVLAAHARTTLRNVARVLRRLETLGYISTETRLHPDGDHDASLYRVHPITAELAQELVARHVSKEKIPLQPVAVVPPGKPQ